MGVATNVNSTGRELAR